MNIVETCFYSEEDETSYTYYGIITHLQQSWYSVDLFACSAKPHNQWPQIFPESGSFKLRFDGDRYTGSGKVYDDERAPKKAIWHSVGIDQLGPAVRNLYDTAN